MLWMPWMCSCPFVPMQFSEMHEQQGKSALLTQQQEGWLRIERMMADIDLQVCVCTLWNCDERLVYLLPASTLMCVCVCGGRDLGCGSGQ